MTVAIFCTGSHWNTEASRFIRDNVEKSADIMEGMMELFGYQNWRPIH